MEEYRHTEASRSPHAPHDALPLRDGAAAGPLISVIAPVYNVAPWLDHCLHSLLAQSYRNLEIILVDDESTDESLAICEAYAARDARVKLLRRNHQGLSSARNTALDVATGAYVAFVDTDDYLEPTMYEVLMNALLAHDADLAICGRIYEREGHAEEVPATDGQEETLLESDELLAAILDPHGVGCVVWNKLYRRELFEDVRFPVGRTYEDIAILPALFRHEPRAVVMGQRLYHHVVREGSISRSGPLSKLFDRADATLDMAAHVAAARPELSPVAGRFMLHCWVESWCSSMRDAMNEDERRLYSEAYRDLIICCSTWRDSLYTKERVVAYLVADHPRLAAWAYQAYYDARRLGQSK